MSEHIFTRVFNAGTGYDIDNPARVDAESNQIHLAKEVETALPGKTFRLICNDTEAKFVFDQTLTAGEITTLTNSVNDHKNNV